MEKSISQKLVEIKALSSNELLKRTRQINATEKKCHVLNIVYISEVGSRKLYLDLGYKSLFEFCVQELGLDEGQVWLRTQVAGVAARFPVVLQYLADSKINLTVAGKLAPHLSETNSVSLLEQCQGMSRSKVEDYLVTFAPKAIVHPTVKRAKSMVPATPEVYNFKFAADKEFKEKLERLGELLGIAIAANKIGEILLFALDTTLARKDPQLKKPRLVKQAQQTSNKRTRYVSATDRIAALRASNFQCEHLSEEGRRCSQRIGLQIDHKIPYAKGGANRLDNYQVLCKAHNLRKAETDFGVEFMEKKLEAS